MLYGIPKNDFTDKLSQATQLPLMFFLYLYSFTKKITYPFLPDLKKRKKSHMASQNSIHPTFENAPTLDHDIFFLPPSEQVNLANLFTNVTITNTNRIHVLSDPLNDPFIPFGWVTKLHVPQQYLQFINIRQLLVGYGVGPSSKPNKHPCENYPRPLRKQFRPTVEPNETDESLYKDLEFIPNRYVSEL